MSDLFEVTTVVGNVGPKAAVVAAAVGGTILYLVCDDGSLRTYKNIASPASRREFVPDLNIPKFMKDRKVCRSLLVVASWNLLISITDTGVLLYPLDKLAKPGVPLSHLSGCNHAAVNRNCTILAVASRTRVVLLSWRGALAGQASQDPNSIFTPMMEKALSNIDEDPVSKRDRDRGSSFFGSSSTVTERDTSAAGLCVTRLAWVGGLLSIAVVHRTEVTPYEVEEEAVPVVDATGTGLDSPRDVFNTGYSLSYLLLHPWTQQLVREIRAGPAPPLDNTGAFVWPPTATEPASLASGGQALVAALSPQAPLQVENTKAKPNPTNSVTVWGAAVLANDAREEEEQEEERGDGGRTAVSSADRAGGVVVSAARQAASGQGGPVVPVGGALTAVGAASSTGDRPEADFSFDGQPLGLYRCSTLPYVISAHSAGLSIHDCNTGQLAQRIKVPGIMSVSSCPSAAAAARRRQQRSEPSGEARAARRSVDEGDEDGVDADDGGDEARDGAQQTEPDAQADGGSSEPQSETLFLITKTGIMAVDSVPLVMQLAALLSRRPPMLETAVAVCEHARDVIDARQGHVPAAHSNEDGPMGTPGASAASIVAGREADIRGQLGYALCAQGDFARGAAHLRAAGVPAIQFLALFPQIHEECDCMAAWGVPSIDDLPATARQVTDQQLPVALPFLLAYLEAARTALLQGKPGPAVIADPSTAVQASDSPSSGLDSEPISPTSRVSTSVLVDEAVLAVLLADAQLMEHGGAKLDASQADERLSSRRARCLALLSSASSCARVAAVEEMLAAYGRNTVLGCPELVALYDGRGMVEAAVGVLAGAAQAAVRTADGLGLPICSSSWTDEDSLSGLEAVVQHVVDLAVYLRKLGGGPHARLVLRTVEKLLAGAGGRVGVLLALWVIAPHAQSDGPRGQKGRSQPALSPDAVLAMLLSLAPAQGDHGQWWALRGTSPLPVKPGRAFVRETVQALLASEADDRQAVPTAGVWPRVQSTADDESNEHAADDEDAEAGASSKGAHADSLALDLRIMPAPANGWARHFNIAYLEGCLVRALELLEAGDAAAASQAMPRDGVQVLLQLYVAATMEASTCLDFSPSNRLEQDSGLLRELRGRLQGLLELAIRHDDQPWFAIDASAGLAQLRQAPFHQERVALLRYLGQHEQALQILLWTMQNVPLAEEYCSAVWEHSQTRAGAAADRLRPDGDGYAAYSALLRVYLAHAGKQDAAGATAESKDEAGTAVSSASVLRPHKKFAAGASLEASIVELPFSDTHVSAKAPHPGGYTPISQMLLDRRMLPRSVVAAATSGAGSGSAAPGSEAGHAMPVSDPGLVAQVLDILARHPDRVLPAEALLALPVSLPLASLLPFVESATRHGKDVRRTVAVAKSFSSVTTARAKAQLVTRQARSVTVEKISTCDVCGRRVAAGGRAGPVVLHPDGAVTHVSCMDRGQARAKVTGAKGAQAEEKQDDGSTSRDRKGLRATSAGGKGQGDGGRAPVSERAARMMARPPARGGLGVTRPPADD